MRGGTTQSIVERLHASRGLTEYSARLKYLRLPTRNLGGVFPLAKGQDDGGSTAHMSMTSIKTAESPTHNHLG